MYFPGGMSTQHPLRDSEIESSVTVTRAKEGSGHRTGDNSYGLVLMLISCPTF